MPVVLSANASASSQPSWIQRAGSRAWQKLAGEGGGAAEHGTRGRAVAEPRASHACASAASHGGASGKDDCRRRASAASWRAYAPSLKRRFTYGRLAGG